MKKNNNIFYGGVTVLIVAASFLYSWKFLIPKYHENQITSGTLDVQIAGESKKLDALKKAQSTLDQLGDIPEQLSIAVPEDKDMPNLITELEALAAKFKMIIPAMQISDGSSVASATGQPAVSGSNGVVAISLAEPGSFEDIHGLVAALEKDIRFMNIKTLAISSITSETGSSGLNVSMQIEAYKRGVAATPAADSSVSTSAAGD